jgi:peptidoglycan/xylan/chitin deacetylase (PgdA/CDA1 family)
MFATIGAGILLAGMLALAVWEVSRARCFALTGPVVYRVETAQPMVALSFDDGPTQAGLDAVLPMLEAHGAEATFFLIGREAAARPDLVARLLASGHEAANHSYSHRRMVGRTPGFHRRELAEAQAALATAGAESRLFRPPYGKKLIGVPLAARDEGLTLIMWDVEDPRTADPAAFADEVVARARPGSIILLHAMYPANATAREALPRILAGLRAKGLRVVGVSTLLEVAS